MGQGWREGSEEKGAGIRGGRRVTQGQEPRGERKEAEQGRAREPAPGLGGLDPRAHAGSGTADVREGSGVGDLHQPQQSRPRGRRGDGRAPARPGLPVAVSRLRPRRRHPRRARLGARDLRPAAQLQRRGGAVQRALDGLRLVLRRDHPRAGARQAPVPGADRRMHPAPAAGRHPGGRSARRPRGRLRPAVGRHARRRAGSGRQFRVGERARALSRPSAFPGG